MQLTPETATEIHRIFDDPEPEETGELETRFAADEPYGPPARRLVELHALLAYLAGDDATADDDDDDDAYER